MKLQNFDVKFDIFAMFVLTNDEMITVRGGDDGEPTPTTPPPPIRILTII
jgi:hypothetical protein